MTHSAAHRRTSQAILEAAAHVLAETPDAPLDEIAHAAEVGRATLYRHFPSREALLEALHDEAVEEIGRRLADASLDRVPVAEAIERIVRATLVVGDRYSVLMYEKPERIEHDRADELIRRRMRAVFERGIADGSLRTDVPLEAMLALFGSALLAGVRIVSNRSASAEDATDFVARVTLGGVAAPSDLHR
jgi:AcrR family transcriptional regulator